MLKHHGRRRGISHYSPYTDTRISNSVEQSPSLEINSHASSKEILCLVWNLKVHYHVHKGQSL